MQTTEGRKLPSLVTSSPVVLGCLGLVLSGAYEAQRSGVFIHSFYALDRFIQYHLDGVAGWSSICAIFGIVAGFLIRRFGERRQMITVGILISVAALLWSTLFLSL
jgi:hypothetical protein